MSSSDVILSQLAEIIREALDDDDLVVTAETQRMEVARWDSLVQLRIMIAIEARYEIMLMPDEFETLTRAGDIVALIETKTGAR